MKDLLHEFGVSMEYQKAWRTIEKTLELSRGKPEDSYQQLPIYLHMLKIAIPGTVTELITDKKNRFKYMFLALSNSIRGWIHCRRVIVVDGTFLKTTYGGTLFTASTMDANNHIFILAFGIEDSENDSSWEWFFNKLRETFGEIELHGEDLTINFVKAEKTYNMKSFEVYMSELDKIDKRIRPYLERIGYKYWSRCHCPTRRYTMMTSNIAELINSTILAIRRLPITTMIESLPNLVQNGFGQKQDKILCAHAIAVFSKRGLRVYDYVAEYYKTDEMKATCDTIANSLPNKSEWTLPKSLEMI
ncbi:uncharacterized protein LOC133031220 [Cannabis sativa]|uniref:uncharacterized protein LOC133031220 n=1 Tax=Cannabis sativa TaxID=3483 RepID=UPI0029CAAB1A|nr:uncharacterized protein LOC133031220 [Cannabis sativa]